MAEATNQHAAAARQLHPPAPPESGPGFGDGGGPAGLHAGVALRGAGGGGSRRESGGRIDHVGDGADGHGGAFAILRLSLTLFVCLSIYLLSLSPSLFLSQRHGYGGCANLRQALGCPVPFAARRSSAHRARPA